MPKNFNMEKDLKRRLTLILKERKPENTPENRELIKKHVMDFVEENYIPSAYFVMTNLDKETGVVNIQIKEVKNA